MLEKTWITTYRRIQLDSFLVPLRKINSKWTEALSLAHLTSTTQHSQLSWNKPAMFLLYSILPCSPLCLESAFATYAHYVCPPSYLLRLIHRYLLSKTVLDSIQGTDVWTQHLSDPSEMEHHFINLLAIFSGKNRYINMGVYESLRQNPE